MRCERNQGGRGLGGLSTRNQGPAGREGSEPKNTHTRLGRASVFLLPVIKVRLMFYVLRGGHSGSLPTCEGNVDAWFI